MMKNYIPEDNRRRPLKSRQFYVVGQCTNWLVKNKVKPNHISIASIIFSLIGAMCFYLLSQKGTEETTMMIILLLIIMICIQARLLCNLLDGMVAIQGGSSSCIGELFNDIPDRVADVLFFVSAGYAAFGNEIGIFLGWSAAVLAVTIAYLRTLMMSINVPPTFHGPMAKPHRMAVLTLGCLCSVIEANFNSMGVSLLITLAIIVAGSFVTCYRRVRYAYLFLHVNK